MALDLRDDARAIFQDVVEALPEDHRGQEGQRPARRNVQEFQEEAPPKEVARSEVLACRSRYARVCEVRPFISGRAEGGRVAHETSSDRPDSRARRLHRRARSCARGSTGSGGGAAGSAARSCTSASWTRPRWSGRWASSSRSRWSTSPAGQSTGRRPPARSRAGSSRRGGCCRWSSSPRRRRGPLRRRHERPARPARRSTRSPSRAGKLVRPVLASKAQIDVAIARLPGSRPPRRRSTCLPSRSRRWSWCEPHAPAALLELNRRSLSSSPSSSGGAAALPPLVLQLPLGDPLHAPCSSRSGAPSPPRRACRGCAAARAGWPPARCPPG